MIPERKYTDGFRRLDNPPRTAIRTGEHTEIQCAGTGPEIDAMLIAMRDERKERE